MHDTIVRSFKRYPYLGIDHFRQSNHLVYKMSIHGKGFMITVSKTRNNNDFALKNTEGDIKREMKKLGFEKEAKDFKLK